jgi:hypothetical protein
MTHLRWRWLPITIQSKHSRRQLPMQRSAYAFAMVKPETVLGWLENLDLTPRASTSNCS